MITITLELPVRLSARLDEPQRQFGDEFIADLLLQALRGSAASLPSAVLAFTRTAIKEFHHESHH
jgi:hypothetical protein